MIPSAILVAYFSRRGSNYVSGSVRDLPVGNTEVVAQMIRRLTGADLYHSEASEPYPTGYNETTKIAQKQLRQHARPGLLHSLANLEAYQTIILGYPNWWGTMPMPVFTFLEGSDFSGKTILPFCTHEGSGLGRSEVDIQGACPTARLRAGFDLVGGTVAGSERIVTTWLQREGLLP